jgi:predicted phage gp36 major capsid-like protein
VCSSDLVTLRRFDDSGFALNGQVGFCAWLRSGGNLLDSNAVKFFQNAAS